MSAKRFKTLSGFLTNVSPVKEGKKQHNWAEGHIQTGGSTEEKVLFFFEKPKVSSSLYENALSACNNKTAVADSGLSEDKDGSFLTCRTSEIKPRQVTFDRREMTDTKIDLGSALTTAPSSDDTVTISGRVVKLNPITFIMKYDNVTHQKVKKTYRTGVVADLTGAVMVMLWEDIANDIREDSSITLCNMRSTIDGNGFSYFTTTFRSELKNSLESCDDYDEDAAEALRVRRTGLRVRVCMASCPQPVHGGYVLHWVATQSVSAK
ncbi:unnamed protein product [Rotaria sordida]|uniref:Replication protein A OB domain-containing protein n=1 Tax=Rotaria sordida TaxID=392033 RepID=A0A815P4G3_9BILA|nr:unnamed protein product [Rotaria sordida]CAF4006903.1 unnamed protein product [Rotaria sordida]